jgi:hypothetical protein
MDNGQWKMVSEKWSMDKAASALTIDHFPLPIVH